MGNESSGLPRRSSSSGSSSTNHRESTRGGTSGETTGIEKTAKHSSLPVLPRSEQGGERHPASDTPLKGSKSMRHRRSFDIRSLAAIAIPFPNHGTPRRSTSFLQHRSSTWSDDGINSSDRQWHHKARTRDEKSKKRHGESTSFTSTSQMMAHCDELVEAKQAVLHRAREVDEESLFSIESKFLIPTATCSHTVMFDSSAGQELSGNVDFGAVDTISAGKGDACGELQPANLEPGKIRPRSNASSQRSSCLSGEFSTPLGSLTGSDECMLPEQSVTKPSGENSPSEVHLEATTSTQRVSPKTVATAQKSLETTDKTLNKAMRSLTFSKSATSQPSGVLTSPLKKDEGENPKEAQTNSLVVDGTQDSDSCCSGPMINMSSHPLAKRLSSESQPGAALDPKSSDEHLAAKTSQASESSCRFLRQESVDVTGTPGSAFLRPMKMITKFSSSCPSEVDSLSVETPKKDSASGGSAKTAPSVSHDVNRARTLAKNAASLLGPKPQLFTEEPAPRRSLRARLSSVAKGNSSKAKEKESSALKVDGDDFDSIKPRKRSSTWSNPTGALKRPNVDKEKLRKERETKLLMQKLVDDLVRARDEPPPEVHPRPPSTLIRRQSAEATYLRLDDFRRYVDADDDNIEEDTDDNIYAVAAVTGPPVANASIGEDDANSEPLPVDESGYLRLMDVDAILVKSGRISRSSSRGVVQVTSEEDPVLYTCVDFPVAASQSDTTIHSSESQV